MKKFRFAFVSNSNEIAQAVRLYSDPSQEDLVLKQATMEEAVKVAKQLLDDGVEVIVGGGGTGHLLLQTLGTPVIRIARSHFDIINALLLAKSFGKLIGLTSFNSPPEGIEVLEDILGIKLHHVLFRTTDELKKGIARAIRLKTDCIVGGGICRRITKSMGGKGILVSPSRETILQSLIEARSLATARRKEKEEIERIRTVIELSKDGIILIDESGRVKIFNQAASELFGVQLSQARDRRLTEILKDTGLLNVLNTGLAEHDNIRKIQDVSVVVNSVPIKVLGETKGAVSTFKEASRIQNIDRKLRERLYTQGFVAKYIFSDIIGSSDVILRLLEMASKYASTDETILIEGETGTGKELLAQGVHNASARKERPFVAINCSALSESLLESELFGHEEGAFTGAKRGGKLGLFEMAHTGTIFLDEIADMDYGLQARLLRVLEQKEVLRVGGDRVVPVDVRVIASTYKNLAKEVRGGRFRTDLYFRLAAFKLIIPPLRERPSDIIELAENFLRVFSQKKMTVSKHLLQCLDEYDWPGNVRELKSLIKRYVVLRNSSSSGKSLFRMIFDEMRNSNGGVVFETSRNGHHAGITNLKDAVSAFEQKTIEDVLKECNFNKKKASRKLGISPNTLWRKFQTPDSTE